MCLHLGNVQYISFLLFQCLLYQIGGSGAESATRLYQHVSTRSYTADGVTTPILRIFLQRHKNFKEQHCSIFPVATLSKWYLDFSFLMALVVTLRCQSEKAVTTTLPIFPEFYNAATNDCKKHGPNHSSTSGTKKKIPCFRFSNVQRSVSANL